VPFGVLASLLASLFTELAQLKIPAPRFARIQSK